MNYSDFSNPKSGYVVNPKRTNYTSKPEVTSSDYFSKAKAITKKIVSAGITLLKGANSTDEMINIYKKTYFTLKYAFDFHPNFSSNHPALKLLENFILKEMSSTEFTLTDESPISDWQRELLYDIQSLPEVNYWLSIMSSPSKTWGDGKTLNIKRSLGSEGESDFLSSILKDLFQKPTNTTRALLGSFNGSITKVSENSIEVTYLVKVWNQLNWESASRFPPSLGGYTNGNSFIPKIKDWYIDMRFETKVVRQKELPLAAPTY